MIDDVIPAVVYTTKVEEGVLDDALSGKKGNIFVDVSGAIENTTDASPMLTVKDLSLEAVVDIRRSKTFSEGQKM